MWSLSVPMAGDSIAGTCRLSMDASKFWLPATRLPPLLLLLLLSAVAPGKWFVRKGQRIEINNVALGRREDQVRDQYHLWGEGVVTN
jgi:hypothetical protein